MLYFLSAICAGVALGHYGSPPCQSDETPLSITGGGVMCSPRCGAGDACPQDLPPGDKVKPRCSLNGPDGHKYCALTCYFGKCPDGASCQWPSGAIVGYCEYPSNGSSSAQHVTAIRTTAQWEEKLYPPAIGQGDAYKTLKASWNISVACERMCQPDPDFSKTDWCKHKNRGGCCVEVNPSWDKVPGYKHMDDFCDKLCMPDGPGWLSSCMPPAEFKHLVATDPLDAIDRFYETHPDQCIDRIGDWSEPNCNKALVV